MSVARMILLALILPLAMVFDLLLVVSIFGLFVLEDMGEPLSVRIVKALLAT